MEISAFWTIPNFLSIFEITYSICFGGKIEGVPPPKNIVSTFSDIVVCSISAQIQEIYFSIKISSHFVFGRESNAQ